MMLKAYLFFVYAIIVVALASFVLCVFNYNPYQATNYQFIFFYTSLGLFLSGVSTLLIFYLKISFSNKETVYKYFWPSIRQGIVIGLAINTLLLLKGLNIFDGWVALPLIIVYILLELFFQTKKKNYEQR